MNKIAIVINGSGGVGKDTICDIVANHYKVMNISAIDPIKKIARENGWDGEKNEKSRKLLANLKQFFIEFNDLPLRHLLTECDKFMKGDDEILFVHIREPEEIKKFELSCPITCMTLLIRRNISKTKWDNPADDNVENYEYDFYYDNDLSLDEVEDDFMKFFEGIIQQRMATDIQKGGSESVHNHRGAY